MSIVSDKTLLAKFAALIQDGDATRIRPCSYTFVPGKIFPTGPGPDGQACAVVDWTIPSPPSTVYAIKPGELLVLRTRERVSMPDIWCGLWCQMDPLSKEGLLLVNMSMVDPGYQGHLTCTLANFGKRDVILTPVTAIAKMIFMELDGSATRKSRPWPTEKYDTDQAALAYRFAPSFLQIAEHTKEIRAAIEEGKATVNRISSEEATKVMSTLEKATARLDADARQAGFDATTAVNTAKDEAIKAVNSAKDDVASSLKTDTWKAVLKATPVAALAILLLSAAQYGADKYIVPSAQSVARVRADEIEAAIKHQLGELPKSPTYVYAGSQESKGMLDRIDAMEKELKAMRAPTAPSASVSVQPGKE